ncbi:MAG: hypothetical protein AAF602_09415, partial [Myxococcota bacterium]
HPVAHDGWAAGPHGRPISEAMRSAVAEAAVPACAVCHLPLREQHDELPGWGRTDGPGEANPAWEGTLRVEGVTCAACHVREGRIAVASEEAARKLAPHPMAYAEELTDERVCAGCHQLTWPGADAPLYDTVGEWSRSVWQAAGVGCTDCHLQGVAPHAERHDPGRAFSLIVRPSQRRLTRGGEPLKVAVTLQNTGAGHTMPTGSPFRGYRVTARITKPGRRTTLADFGQLVADLSRTLSAAPPWTTIADTRLPAGGERTFAYEATFSQRWSAGRYDLVVELWRTREGTVVGEPVTRQRIDLIVQ